jgi:ribonuclease HII
MLPIYLEDTNLDEIIVGCDEVGRGCGSGPVCAACVVWSSEYVPKTTEDEALLNMIKDSKKLSAKNREKLSIFIKNNAIAYSIATIDNKEIDKINILQATFKAFHKALDELNTNFDRIMVDGDKFKTYMNKDGDFVPHTCISKGDNKLLQIAAASIIAKVYRDNYITDLHNSDEKLQVYHWDKNKGYLTKEHINAIRTFGLSEYHRESFIHL